MWPSLRIDNPNRQGARIALNLVIQMLTERVRASPLTQVKYPSKPNTHPTRSRYDIVTRATHECYSRSQRSPVQLRIVGTTISDVNLSTAMQSRWSAAAWVNADGSTRPPRLTPTPLHSATPAGRVGGAVGRYLCLLLSCRRRRSDPIRSRQPQHWIRHVRDQRPLPPVSRIWFCFLPSFFSPAGACCNLV